MKQIALQKYSELKISSQMRFMLQDIIELQQNNWNLRRDKNKISEQIHLKAKQEKKQLAIYLQKHQMQKRLEDRGKRKGWHKIKT